MRAVYYADLAEQIAAKEKKRAMRRFEIIAAQPGQSTRRYQRAYVVQREAMTAAFAAERRHSRWYRAHLRAARRCA